MKQYDNELVRVIVVLRVLANNVGAKQRDLIGNDGLLNKEWERLGLMNEFPYGFKHAPALQRSVTKLRECSLMQSYEKGQRARAYELTLRGKRIVKAWGNADSLGEDWHDWPEWADLCE